MSVNCTLLESAGLAACILAELPLVIPNEKGLTSSIVAKPAAAVLVALLLVASTVTATVAAAAVRAVELTAAAIGDVGGDDRGVRRPLLPLTLTEPIVLNLWLLFKLLLLALAVSPAPLLLLSCCASRFSDITAFTVAGHKLLGNVSVDAVSLRGDVTGLADVSNDRLLAFGLIEIDILFLLEFIDTTLVKILLFSKIAHSRGTAITVY
jgi:hypothetical protein